MVKAVKTLSLDTLYLLQDGSGTPVLQINGGGTANIYASYKLPTGSPLTDDMALMKVTEVGDAMLKLNDVPPYIYITQATATVSDCYLAGVVVEAV